MHPKLALALAASTLAAAAGSARADIGPKPTAAFRVAFDRPGLSIASGDLLQCRDATCADAKPLEALGPQRFGCQAAACSAMAYGFAPFGQVRLVLSDGRTLTSNSFAIRAFNARFAIRVAGSALRVTPAR